MLDRSRIGDSDNNYSWTEKHLYWCKALSRQAGLSEDALWRFTSLVSSSRHGDDETSISTAPRWLHALWDTCTELVWNDSRSPRVPLTGRKVDLWAVARVCDSGPRGVELQRAIDVTYQAGDVAAVAALLTKLASLEGVEWKDGSTRV